MEEHADSSPDYEDDPERFPLLREMAGFVVGVLSLLLLLALIACEQNADWIGLSGKAMASVLFLVFGRVMAYALPIMAGMSAFHLLRSRAVAAGRERAWLRGLGGMLILVATCALLTLPAMRGGDCDKTRALRLGGIVGSFLMCPDGLSQARQLGPVGSAVVFGGLSLMGLVLFTETFLRDLVALTWRGFSRLAGWALGERWARLVGAFWGSVHFVGAILSLLNPLRWWRAMRRWHPLDAVATLVRRCLGWVFQWGFLWAFRWAFHWFRWPWLSRVPQAFGLDPISRLEPIGRRRVFGRRDPSAREGDAQGVATATDELATRMAAERSAAMGSRSSVFPLAARATDREGEASGPSDVFAVDSQAPSRPAGVAADWRDLFGAAGGRDGAGVAMEQPSPPMLAPPVPARSRPQPVQAEMDLFPSDYQLPSLDLLGDPPATRYVMTDEEKEALSRKIEQTLAQFKVEVQVFEVIQGPVITRFAMKVAPGVRVSRILALESELAMALKAHHVRILAPIPGQSAVGVEVPNKRANMVTLKELLACEEFQNHKSTLAFALGENIAGEPTVCDLARMPHLLIAGATGSGKSVCLNTIIASFLYRNKPDRVKFVMIDPKRVELSIYQAIAHLCAPVVTEPKKAAAALAWCVEQMENRYKRLAEVGVRNIDGYNALVSGSRSNKKLIGHRVEFMPHMVIIIDELADLMLVAKNEVEEYIIRLAHMARAVGMHLILATQRPSVNVITGIIKANFPSRIAFQVSSKVDSRTILDMNGAEALMGRGDMLYSPGGVKPFRLQGAFVSDSEVERLADTIRGQEKVRYVKEDFEAKPTSAERAKAYHGLGGADGAGDGSTRADDPATAAAWAERAAAMRSQKAEYAGDGADGGADGNGNGSGDDRLPGMAARGRVGEAPLKPCDFDAMTDEDLYAMALRLVLESRKASVSYIQRRLKIGYARAGRLMDMMEDRGIVGPYQGSKPRDLMVDPADYLAQSQQA
jgi:DNA segregation ATPase FtsK/SpoIIIE-like protein